MTDRNFVLKWARAWAATLAQADDPAGYPVALSGAGLPGDRLSVECWNVSDQGRSKCMPLWREHPIQPFRRPITNPPR